MIKNTYTLSLPHTTAFKEGWCIIDIITEGRYWRTSRLLRAYAITFGTPHREHEWIAEREADEYDILAELSQVIGTAKHIMTFNGTGFDIPHLRKKYQAYRAADPTSGRGHMDLMHALRPYQFLFGLESHHLNDYLSLFRDRYAIRNDAEGTLLVSSLLDLSHVFTMPADEMNVRLNSGTIPMSAHGNAEMTDSVMQIEWQLPCPAPCDLVITDEVFHMEVRERNVCLEAVVTEGMLRRYYPDYMNYDYLLAEGYAVHKTLAAYVAKDRKTQAVRENCYCCLPISAVYPERPERLRKYVESSLVYLRRDIPVNPHEP